jgi:hydroxyacylglutathione hydrolase
MKVETVVVGYLETNCYIMTAGSASETFIVDPGANSSRIVDFLEKRALIPKKILVTHGHNDHIGALNTIMGKYRVPVLINEREAEFMHVPPAERRGYDPDADAPGIYLLRDGDTIALDGKQLTALHTPGHTPGGMSFLTDGICFTGDTLFNDGVGRTDFEGGDHATLMNSLREKLLTLPDKTIIYPGHGPSSTIGRERRYF